MFHPIVVRGKMATEMLDRLAALTFSDADKSYRLPISNVHMRTFPRGKIHARPLNGAERVGVSLTLTAETKLLQPPSPTPKIHSPFVD